MFDGCVEVIWIEGLDRGGLFLIVGLVVKAV